MKKIRNIVFYEPGEAHFDTFRWRAESMIEAGYITEVPIITKEEASMKPFWVIILEVPDADVPFWMGVNSGFDICRNNRSLMVGVD